MRYTDTPAFTPTRLEEERKEEGKIITVRLNKEELEQLEADAKILHQPKLSTAFKFRSEIGRVVLHDRVTGEIIKTVFKNKANNRRTGNELI